MLTHIILNGLAPLLLITGGAFMQEEPDSESTPPIPLSPNEIASSAGAFEWQEIAPQYILRMELTPTVDGDPRIIFIQLAHLPVAEPWVKNIQILAKAGWFSDSAILRVQDNYVVQWGHVDEKKQKIKPFPSGFKTNINANYTQKRKAGKVPEAASLPLWQKPSLMTPDPYADHVTFHDGWPFGQSLSGKDPPTHRNEPNGQGHESGGEKWLIHCYGTVGVGRDLHPHQGDGSSLYAVIGHAPRHLDRNIAVIGRVIEGIEHLSSLPRGKGPLGFYMNPADHIKIQHIQLMSSLPREKRVRFHYLKSNSQSFQQYIHARANRGGPFFIRPAGGAAICNIPVPIKRINEK